MGTLFAGLEPQALLVLLVNLVLAVSVAELLWLLIRPSAIPNLMPNLLAGLCLTLALRLSLGGAGVLWIAPCLLGAGLAHLRDLQARHSQLAINPPPVHPSVKRKPS